ncbi:hypothetical protein MED134_04469 [Dokdonia sp. MED134]|uniref:DUF2461 domain-containing protein n=1 Tax=Dokdonia sp. MED134 TaxID=313590 RepID=UPI000068AC4D|nr:DUF2461 domain-containing protein [Dokdonia sp. MED134]EAQ39977.1 hypothetical protein MED134_04469 [Dokdonia sp. MED134]
MITAVPKASLTFLKDLKKNNTREWMADHKSRYQDSEKVLKDLYATIKTGLNETDDIEKLKVFRINRDIRFSKDKTPYNVHRSASFSRAGAHRRGGYYLRIEPGDKSVIAGGFFNPEKEDLKRIRTEFHLDASDIRDILNDYAFAKAFPNGFETTNAVKTAPRDFDKNDPNIDLIKLKSFVVRKEFTDREVMQSDFSETVVSHYKLLRPYFDYMSDVLTTDLNGESIL